MCILSKHTSPCILNKRERESRKEKESEKESERDRERAGGRENQKCEGVEE